MMKGVTTTMNKRNTEGFVLAYVMIVIAVVSAITMALTTSTLNVLKAQEQSVERMQDKYEVMGEIEKLAAALQSLKNPTDSEGKLLSKSDFDSCEGAFESARLAFSNYLVNDFPFDINSAPHSTEDDSLCLNVKVENNSISIETDIIIELDITCEPDESSQPSSTEPAPVDESDGDDPDGGSGDPQPVVPPEPPTYKYTVHGIKSLYFDTYTISTPEPEGGAA